MDIKTVLEFSPFDNKRLSPFGSNNPTEDFYKYYFVDYPAYAQKLEANILTTIDKNTNTILFYGASGSGKTTFLHQLSRKYKDKYRFHFLNLIEKPSLVDYKDCIRTALLGQLYNIFNKQDEVVSNKLYEVFVKSHDAMPLKSKYSNAVLINYLINKEIEMVDASYYLSQIDDNQDLLILYVIASIVENNQELKDEKNVFVFDNLDEIPTEYISVQVNDVVQSAYSAAQFYFEQYLDFRFLKNCTFLLSFRTTNVRLVDKTQLQERQKLTCEEIEFGKECQVSYPSILKKRVDHFIVNQLDKKRIDAVDSFCQLINSEKKYCADTLKPLYNYDYRMFTHYFILKSLEKIDNPIGNTFYEVNKEGKKKDHYQLGSRGILLFNALSGMLKDDSSRFHNYVRHEFIKETICNIYRMSFTLLSNLGEWTERNQDLQWDLKEESDFNKETIRILLYDFVTRIESWYGKEYVKMALDGLIGSTAYNFEYPVTLIGSSIDAFINESEVGHSNSALAKHIIELYETNKSALANISVKIHPSCVVYADRVFIHFEYFNLISSQWDNPIVEDYKYQPTPLFLITNEYMLKACLKSVFETVRKILKCADGHFCNNCIKNERAGCSYTIDKEGKYIIEESSNDDCRQSVDRFIAEGFCFNKTLYATRVITSHINYLDKYRAYVWDNKQIDDEQRKQWQIILLGQISEYIELWENRSVKDKEQRWLNSVDYAYRDIENNKFSSVKLN